FNYCIKKFTADLRFVSKWGSAESIGIKLYMPHEIAIAKDGNVILSDRQNHRLSIFTPDGKLVKCVGEYGEGTEAKGGQFSEPHGLAVGSKGEIFVTDRYNFRIQKLAENGQPQFQWLSSGILQDDKHFPLGIAIGSGSVFITDHYSHSIQKYKLKL
ncbi:MAG TPA: NHL repeat-containing protein, partial [Flavisolibacter sp.]|nr:NHL repeat-containing protein [Flavisolibacter sp.]